MATSHTSVGTVAAAGTPRQEWSVNTLCDHIVGLFAGARNWAGGTTPDRVKNIVRNSLRFVHNVEDWRWEMTIGTLDLAASASTITLPQDYRKAATSVLKDVDEAPLLPLTDNLTKWQQVDSGYQASYTGFPVLGAIMYDTTEDCDWILNVTPTSNAAYSFEFPYLRRCPVDLVAGHADLKTDDQTIPMPMAMHKLWELHAFWQVQEHFGKEVEAAKRAQDHYDKAHRAALDEQNETLAEPIQPTARGYDDELLFDTGVDGGRSDADRMFYDVL